MGNKKKSLRTQLTTCAAGVLLIGMLILGTQSPALAGPVFDNPDFILIFPGASQKISYDLPDEFRVDQRIFHTCYVLALPGIFNTTPTYKLNYVSGGKFTTKVSEVKYGLGLFFTFATRPYDDPEFPVTVKQTFTFAPPAK
jgi:hypothetical protein